MPCEVQCSCLLHPCRNYRAAREFCREGTLLGQALKDSLGFQAGGTQQAQSRGGLPQWDFHPWKHKRSHPPVSLQTSQRQRLHLSPTAFIPVNEIRNASPSPRKSYKVTSAPASITPFRRAHRTLNSAIEP